MCITDKKNVHYITLTDQVQGVFNPTHNGRTHVSARNFKHQALTSATRLGQQTSAQQKSRHTHSSFVKTERSA